MHWNSLFSSDARVGALVNPVVDPVSGEPEFKHTPARVVPFVVAWQGFALSRKPLMIRDRLTRLSGRQNTYVASHKIAALRLYGSRTVALAAGDELQMKTSKSQQSAQHAAGLKS